MKAGDAYPGLPVMFILVIVTYLVKVIAVIKNADSEDFQ
jgi:hypothetical protein